MTANQSGTSRELEAQVGVSADLEIGTGIVIAHPSPSVRVKLAMGLIDDHPVFMANGPIGLLRQLEAVVDGVVRAPQALVLGERELRALRGSHLWAVLEALPMTIVLVATRRRRVTGVDAVYAGAPRPDEVRALLAA